jgi:hypothetical protein
MGKPDSSAESYADALRVESQRLIEMSRTLRVRSNAMLKRRVDARGGRSRPASPVHRVRPGPGRDV